MPSSEEFKQAIREGRVHDAFVLAIAQASELEITTWIASAETAQEKPESDKFLQTQINLVEGEITNKIGGEIIGDNLYTKAQDFHTQQVSQGHQIISHNLESLQQILRLTTILQKQKRGESYQPLKPFKISSDSLPKANVFQLPETENLTESAKNSPYINPISILAEEDSSEDNMLSLGDLEAEADKIADDNNPENKDDDWGDWLEDGDEDNLDLDTDILTLDAFDLDESEEWENDETEFVPNSEITSTKKEDDKSEH